MTTRKKLGRPIYYDRPYYATATAGDYRTWYSCGGWNTDSTASTTGTWYVTYPSSPSPARIKIVDQDGEPVRGAIVLLARYRGKDGGYGGYEIPKEDIKFIGETNNAGIIEFPVELCGDKYYARVRCAGYRSAEAIAELGGAGNLVTTTMQRDKNWKQYEPFEASMVGEHDKIPITVKEDDD